jgi:hypothetical protein
MAASNAGPSTRLSLLLVATALLVVLFIGALIGIRLGGWASSPRVEVLRVREPASLPAAADRGATSGGGFDGFGGPPALQGDVLREGRVVEAGPGRLVVESGGGRAIVEYDSTAKFYRLAASSREPVIGDAVVIRTDGTALLVTNP